MNIEFIELLAVDEKGNTVRVYRALYREGQGDVEERTIELTGTDPGLRFLEVTRQDVLDLGGLEDVGSPRTLVEAILARMQRTQWPQGVSSEAHLFAVVNEALHVLEKTATDFL